MSASARSRARPPAREDPFEGRPAGDDGRVSILLVDDAPENLLTLQAVLEPLGQRLITAESGEQALRVLLREDVAMIILDVRMAGLDGLETARIIRSRPRTRRVPIIFLTAAASDVDDISRAYATGAVDYVIKPFAPEVLRAKVSVFVELSRERAERIRQTRARAQAETVAATVRKLQIVSDAALAHLELEELLPEILERTSSVFEAESAGILLRDEDGAVLSLRAAQGEPLLPDGHRVVAGEGPLGRVAGRARPAVVAGQELASLAAGTTSRIASLLALPLIGPSGVVGLLYLGTHRELGFPDEDRELLVLAADRVAIAIHHAERFAHELELAEMLQRSLLSERLPVHSRLKLAARYLPSELATQVGGDWYDALLLEGDRLGVMIGDVVGHGVNAATTMGELRSALRAFAIEGHGPGEALQQLDRVVFGTRGPGMLATALFMIIDSRAGTATVASVGHPPPALVRQGGDVGFIDTVQAPPLGVDAHGRVEQRVCPIGPGDTLLLFTDGLVERRYESIDEGFERLREALADAPEEVEALCDHVLARTLGDHPGRDDVALLAVRLAEEPAGQLELNLPATPDSIPVGRRRLRGWLGATLPGIDAAFAQDAELAATEACTNAVRHAYGPGDATFSLSAELLERELVLEVRDHGAWREPRGRHGGRGLQLIRAICAEVEIDRSAEGTQVRMHLALPAPLRPDATPAPAGVRSA